MIVGNMIGGRPSSPKTIKFLTNSGQEIQAVLVDTETVFTAEANDVREGKTFASDYGVGVGNRVIPAYHTFEGYRIIPAGSAVTIPNQMASIDSYDYTKLQVIICAFNSNVADSVSAEKISVYDKVHNVQTVDVVSEVIKNHESKNVDLGIINDSGTIWILRYFMYKEII